MKSENIEKYLSKLKGAEGRFPFGPEALVFKVMGLSFLNKEENPRVTLKCRPADGKVLVDQFESVTPGYYMNKKTLNYNLPKW